MTQSNHRSQQTIESRRKILKFGACSAMTNATFLSTLMHLKMTSAVMADAPVVEPTGGYKALVCLFFNGAIDSFNVLTPYGTSQTDAEFANYATTRSGAALKRTAAWDTAWTGTDYGYLNPIVDSSAAGGTGKTLGLHPRFVHLKSIYDAGHATMVANCGALVDPIANNQEFDSISKIKPIGLYSHPDQQRHWQTAVPTSRGQVQGWAGKMADLLTDSGLAAAQSNVYTAISTYGQSLLLTGHRIKPYTIESSGAVLLDGQTNPATPYDRVYSTVQADLASQTYSNLLEQTIRDSRVTSRDAAAAFQDAFNTTTLPGSPALAFPTTGLGASLSAVAKSIKLAQSPTAPLHQERQIFLVQVDGWDHHSDVLGGQNTMIPAIDNGLKAFYDFMVAESLLSKVTLFTISDFGRTWSFNGSGTDHGWGGNTIVMGGAVNATAGVNRIWGSYPEILPNTSPTGLDRGRGVVIPQTSSDVYHAELCRWFGIPNNEHLVTVLPNIRNFYSAGSSSHPVGFLQY
jgi:uncharacterized protein (DUF1501 family)